MALTRENTEALNAVSSLTVSQRGLEAGLTATRKTMFADPVLQRRQEVGRSDDCVVLSPAVQIMQLLFLRASYSLLEGIFRYTCVHKVLRVCGLGSCAGPATTPSLSVLPCHCPPRLPAGRGA
jgi:hypothetical protein